MSAFDRKESEVRRMLDAAHTPVPADLAARASARGARLLRRRHGLHVTLWTLAAVAAVLFAAWAATTQPWAVPHTQPPPVFTW
ncbi:hypothetical protein [Streptomyces sp. RKND-216]|uniref:hypothetical protein n=1 Tax=Streptomyces sp. RKND-216 TaxID=2562581 RepID=UPI001B3509D4|nr:hypothetical protein [Streptomyces sp. RKND-216]